MSLRNDRLTLEKSSALDEIREKYEAEQRKKTIADQQLVIEKERSKTNVIILISIIAVMAGMALYLYYRYRQRARFEKEMQHQYELRMKAIVTTQEDTQQKIAKDIHDSVGQTLAAAKLAVETGLNKRSDSVEFIKTSSLIDTACHKIRKISHQLLPHSLRVDGLLPAIDELMDDSFRHTKIEYEFNHHHIPGRLDEQVEINLYRIIQELISNILKHADAHKVSLQFVKNENELILWMEDNGQGFDQATKKTGIGLINIKSRLELIKGKLNIETEPGNGTIHHHKNSDMSSISVFVVDDHHIILDGLASLIDSIEGLRLAGKASSGMECVKAIANLTEKPDVCLVDIDMPEMNGVEVVKLLKKEFPKIKVMALTMHDERYFINRMIVAGADGYLIKNVDRSAFEKTIKKVVSEAMQSDFIVEGKHKVKLQKTDDAIPVKPLTSRELQVLRLIAKGYSSNEIAGELHISYRTVDTHRTHLKQKLKASTIAALVQYAYENGHI